MEDDQDWRLRVDVDDPAALHASLRHGGAALEREVGAELGDQVVLSFDEGTLFAYAGTRALIDDARAKIERRLAADGVHAAIELRHWDDEAEGWLDPDASAADVQRARASTEEADARVVTRTVAITAGRMSRGWFEDTVVSEARELGVEISIAEHRHLLTTQIAFKLHGPSEKVEQVVGDLRERAEAVTRLDWANLAPI